MSFYMIVISNQNLKYYPDNEPYHFKTKLQQTLQLPGKWKISLTEVSFLESKSSKVTLYIYTDICRETVINGINAPLLRRTVSDTGKNTTFKTTNYIPIVKSEINEIEFLIKKEDRSIALHLKKTRNLSTSPESIPILHVMDLKRLYLPDHKKWLKYYQGIGKGIKSGQAEVKRKSHQVGGSFGKTINQLILPIESKPEIVTTKSDDPIEINLVSAAEATVQQAESQLSREAEQFRSLKRKRSSIPKVNQKKKRKTSKISTTFDIFSQYKENGSSECRFFSQRLNPVNCRYSISCLHRRPWKNILSTSFTH